MSVAARFDESPVALHVPYPVPQLPSVICSRRTVEGTQAQAGDDNGMEADTHVTESMKKNYSIRDGLRDSWL